MSKHKKWTPAEDRDIKRLAADADLTVNEIAEQLGVHRMQLLRRMKKLGVSKADDVWTEDRVAFITKQVPLRGYEYCAQKLSVSVESVRMKARRLGLASPRPRTKQWSADEDRLVIERRGQGVSFADIASEVGRTQEAVRYRHKVLRGVMPATESIMESWFIGLYEPCESAFDIAAEAKRFDEPVVFSPSVNLARRWRGPYVAEIRYPRAGIPAVDMGVFYDGEHPDYDVLLVSDSDGLDRCDICTDDTCGVCEPEIDALVFAHPESYLANLEFRLLSVDEIRNLDDRRKYHEVFFPSDPEMSGLFFDRSTRLHSYLEHLNCVDLHLWKSPANDPIWASVRCKPLPLMPSGRQTPVIEFVANEAGMSQHTVLIHGLTVGIPMCALALW